MKRDLISSAPLYTFLSYCNDSPMDKEVLDCGAGGSPPPLATFFEYGYRTYGIDISEKQLEKARKFCINKNMDLKIMKGDMRSIPFKDESLSFIYSYSSICHMTKADVTIAIKEITRILKKGGLCFISFCAVIDQSICDKSPRVSGEYPFEENGETGVHSIFGDNEPDHYFPAFTYLRKEKRYIKNFGKQKGHSWAELLYFMKKR